ncbi:HlyD family type I secretion periplasmic adaptor subunit [Devosia rhizoryzae]|uniref:Membrane fusion protein (MFP) family protein n=1 Tax=Devosia rhizoryzae TaxID=2774137 RepID=A0ABX7C4W3_9HYPH|nr:HlyD family type I secretion periplasmic adaptor subunit [Devosia rhizoryzae]QQR39256.1 HlyD family type I secretion periplasmic adaptor subunit [Devosia rhizoryzae]
MTTIDSFAPYGATAPSFKAPKGQSDPFAMRGRVAWGVLFGVLLLGGVGGWAVTAKLSGAVIGVGTVLVDQDLKVVQHIDGGVLRQIAVKEGDTVTQGQVLLRLDDVQIGAERSIVMGQLLELTARQVRLLAERDGADGLDFPSQFLDQHPDASMIASGEEQLFAGNLRNLQSQKDQLQLQIGQLGQEITGLQFQRTAVLAELDLALDERDRMRSLAESRLIETSRVSDVEREVARMQGQQGEIDANLARAESRISEIELQILALDGTVRTEAQRELRVIEAQIAELTERLAAVEERFARTEIRAPVSGTINELNVTTIGGVISPAERLMTIVPADADLSIEFRIATNDIDQISVGQDAKLRFSAFNQRVTPEVDGVITLVSAAAQHNPQTGESYYLAQVETTGQTQSLGARGLVPGMPVEVFVQTEEQVALAYFMKPFTDQVTRAFREE